MPSMMADQGNSGGVLRQYRKGNWTVHETMVLIAAKKMDEERRMKRSGDGEGRSNKPAELRWKWVEDYCWKHGCLRSQNQCNDKWDNLMRDYKKVREYERRLAERDGGEGSYWKLEKHERKDRNLPSNMLPEIYDAVVEVVEKRAVQRVTGGSISNIAHLIERTTGIVNEPPTHSLLQCYSSDPNPPLPLLPPPPSQPLPHSQPLPLISSDSDTSEHSNSSAKRRRRGEGTSSSGNTSYEVGSAISKSASIIAEALQACEEKEEKRHRELLSLQERRLKVEESKTEMEREGINGLVDAINKLASSILALVSDKNSSAPK